MKRRSNESSQHFINLRYFRPDPWPETRASEASGHVRALLRRVLLRPLEDEARAAPRAVLHPGLAAMQLRDVLDDGEPEAGAAILPVARRVAAEKALEDPRLDDIG